VEQIEMQGDDVLAYLLSRSERLPNGCREWRRKPLASGYGQAKVKGKRWRVHRLAWTVLKGPIPPRLLVLHHCDNRLCWEDSHLYLGDNKQNAADREARKRHPHPATKDQRGGANGNAKLSWEMVRTIRAALAQGVRRRDLAVQYSVTKALIGQIDRGEKWIEPCQ
jgi:hypothetical protein